MTDAPVWRFRRMQPGEMNIDPIEGEFFSTDALGSLADALVREAIQNSLDARLPGRSARMRIAFPPSAAMLAGENRQRYLAGLWPHLLADRSGLTGLPAPESPLNFLVVEDFGTRGLQGDPRQSEDEEIAADTARNDFYYFWRNVGRSRKASAELGRWGLGKTVFPAASRVNAFLAFTVRHNDGRRLLMGQAVLRIHRREGVRYYPYGYFARFDDDFALPVEDETFLAGFCRDFRIARDDEPGLSVVIPYADPEVTPGDLMRSVVRHYFVPILAGDLTVEVEHDGRGETLNADSLARVLGRVDWAEGAALQRLAELARWGLSLPAERCVRLPEQSAGAAPRWAGEGEADKVLTALRETFNRGEPIAVRVPVWVKPATGDPVNAAFDVYLERDDTLTSGEEHFVRDGITIAGTRSGVQAGVRAIVCVRDRALSGLLGDSENPAHTEWQERSPRFQGRYRHGPFTLRYVKGAPREIVRILTRPAEGRDPTLLRHLFSLDMPTEEAVRQREGQRTDRTGIDSRREGADIEAVGSDRFFVLQKLHGGFRIVGTGNGAAVPRYVAVVVAYEVRRGNPFVLYQPLDFAMEQAPITVTVEGAGVIQQAGNKVVLQIHTPEFRVSVQGFDPRRDVRVKTLALDEDAAA